VQTLNSNNYTSNLITVLTAVFLVKCWVSQLYLVFVLYLSWGPIYTKKILGNILNLS